MLVIVNNVSIGDVFMYGKRRHRVVDIYVVKSLLDGETKEHQCVVQPLEGFATNRFKVPFSTVVRNRVK